MSCIGLRKKDIKRILLSISKAYHPIGTFAVINGFNELLKSNLNKAFADYENGSFWARDWVASGADHNEMKREFPLVLLECSEARISQGKVCRRYGLSVVGLHNCEDCKTREETSDDMLTMLRVVLREFRAYAKFDRGWANLGVGSNLGWGFQEETVGDYLDDEIEIFEVSRNMEDMIGWSLNFEVCDCDYMHAANLDWSETPLEVTGVTECEDCP